MIDELIAQRGLDLECKLSSLPSYKILTDCVEGAKLIVEHLSKQSKIVVLGDRDTDGITSTSLLMRFFNSPELYTCKPNVSFFIPNRAKDGYGMTDITVDKLLLLKPKLVITVDSAVTAFTQVERLKSMGVDCLVTDHHELKDDRVPKCLVINPKRDNNELLNIAGVGVAFYLIAALRAELGLNDCNLVDYLDLVAIGTVADQVELLGVNRILVTHGLKVLNRYDRSNYYKHVFQQNNRITEWKADTIGFQLSPRLNASGRLLEASIGARFLMSDNTNTAQTIYGELDTLNKKRRKIQASMTTLVMKDLDIGDRDGVVIFNKDLHEGIIGIIASKVLETYGLPTIVITESNNEIKGSCRSKTTSILDILNRCGDSLFGSGGHIFAGGANIKNLEQFTKQFYQACTDLKSDDNKVDLFHFDGTLEWEEVTLALLDKLKKMEPFGMGNNLPVFKMKAGLLNTEPTILKDKHLKWSCGSIDVVYWNHTTLPRIKEIGVTIDEGYSSDIQMTIQWVR